MPGRIHLNRSEYESSGSNALEITNTSRDLNAGVACFVQVALSHNVTLDLANHPKEDIVRQHALFILASFWDKELRVPEHWRGQPYTLIRELAYLIRKEFGIEGWHHASRNALPLGVDTSRMLAPEDDHGLIYVAALEYALTKANWQLIEYESNSPTQESEDAVFY